MKYITLMIGLLVVGCGKQEKADTNESTPTTNTNKVDGTTAKPIKGLTLEEEKVVGTYEGKKYGLTYRVVLLEYGICEKYFNGKKLAAHGKWKIVEGQIHIDGRGNIEVYRINSDKSITSIATINKDGKRIDFPKEGQMTLKKIK